MAGMLDIGIWGATGKLGTSLYQRLISTRPILRTDAPDLVKKIYVEMRRQNPLLESFFRTEANLRNAEHDIVYIQNEGDYARFKDCDVIIIAAGKPMPASWADKERKGGNGTLKDLEDAVLEDFRKDLQKEADYLGEVKKAKETFIRRSENKEVLEFFNLQIGRIMTEEEIKAEAAKRLEKEKDDLQYAFDIFNIMKGLKESGVPIGERGLYHFPRNVRIMQKYAGIAKKLHEEGFKGLVCITTNVPEYCCSIFSSIVPELTESIVGLTDFDTLRGSYDIMPGLEGGQLLNEVKSIVRVTVPSLGDHDDGTIFAPELAWETTESMTLTTDQRKAVNTIVDEAINTFKGEEAKKGDSTVKQIMDIYAHVNKSIRGVTGDAVEAVIRLLGAVYKSRLYKDDKEIDRDIRLEILTNAIFHQGVFVILPHVMDFTRVVPYDYEGKISKETRERLKKCIEGKLMRVNQALLDAGVISNFPFVKHEQPPIYVLPELPRDLVIFAANKLARDDGKLQLNMYNANLPNPVGSFLFDKSALKYIGFDGANVILKTVNTVRDRDTNEKVTKNTILRYVPGSIEPQAKIEIDGSITDVVLSAESRTYFGSSENNSEGVVVFNGDKKEKVYRTKDSRAIYSIAISEINGKRHLIGSSQGTLHVWEENSDKEKFALEGGIGYLNNIKIIGSLCFASDSSMVYVWDIEKRKFIDSHKTFHGQYDVEELGGPELTLVHQRGDEYAIQSFELRKDGTMKDKGKPCHEVSTLEIPTDIEARGGYIFMINGQKVCWAEKKPGSEFKALNLANADLESLCIFGGKE